MTGTNKKNKQVALSPLRVYIVWHPNFADGRKYADMLFRTFSRDAQDFCGQNIGIPMYYVSDTIGIVSVTDEAEKIAIIPLIDNSLLLDNGWKSYISAICGLPSSNSRYVVYPIAFTAVNNVTQNICGIGSIQCLCVANIGGLENDGRKFELRSERIKFDLAHEFCRLFFGQSQGTTKIVNVFISHAHNDDTDFAKSLSDYILTDTRGLKSFIDVNDIPVGADFAETIKNNVSGSILAIVFSDKYSSRAWCQKEVLTAKELGCPILLLDALSVGEVRRFPYGANVKSIHLGHDEISSEQKQGIIFAMLMEALKIKYSEKYLAYVRELYGLAESETRILGYSPELCTLLLTMKNEHKVLLYPEPALNIVESEIIEKFLRNCKFVTTAMLPSAQYDISKLGGKAVGLSISEIGEAGSIARTDAHLGAFYVELCRYLFTAGVNLSYAGNVNYKEGVNFVDILKELADNYSSSKKKPVKFFYLSDTISNDLMVALMSCSELEEVSSDGTPDEKYTRLRICSAKGNFARIVVGGKTSGYKGKYPGILEEALIARKNKVPLFLLGAYGGMTEEIVKWAGGANSSDKAYASIAKDFAAGGFRFNNGLSEDENKELAYCDDIAKSIALIIKGLINIAEGHNVGK